MNSVNGNYSFSFSFSQSSSYSYSSDGMRQQEKLETSNQSELTFESSGKKEALDFSMRDKARSRFGNDRQEHNHARRGGRKHHDHDHNNRLGFGRGKGTERAMKMVEKALERGYEALEAKVNAGFGGNAVNSQERTSPVATYVQIADEKPTAEKVSSNILGFIDNKMTQVAAEGGTQADIESILDQGLSGFKQGFGEAKEQIEVLGMLDEYVAADIGQTYDRVLTGIDKLREPYLGESTEVVIENAEVVLDDLAGLPVEEVDDDAGVVIPTSTKAENAVEEPSSETELLVEEADNSAAVVIPTTAEAKNAVDESTIETVLPNAAVEDDNKARSVPFYTAKDIISDPLDDLAFGIQGSQSSSYASYDALNFQLVTQDGDVVTLNFSDVEAYGQQYDFAEGLGLDGLYSQENLATAFYENTEFSIDVEGDLDSDEMKAISDTMNQVRKLAGEFFAGNPQKAFERALDMGFDESEIAQYSLNMTSIDVMQIETSYGAIANMDPVSGDSVPVAEVQEPVNPLKDLGGYIKGLMDAMNTTQGLGESKFLADAMRNIEATSQLEIINDSETHSIKGFTDFNEKLLENLS